MANVSKSEIGNETVYISLKKFNYYLPENASSPPHIPENVP